MREDTVCSDGTKKPRSLQRPASKKAKVKQAWPHGFTRACGHAVKRFLSPIKQKTLVLRRAINSDPAHNVVGVGLSWKCTKGRRRKNNWCLVFYVRHKLGKKEIGSKFMLPTSLFGIQTDVVAVGMPRFVSLAPGDQVAVTGPFGPNSIEKGTISGIVKDSGGKRYILSNNHVLADFGRKPQGSKVFDQQLTTVAKLKVVVPLQPAPVINDADAALAELQPGISVTAIMPTPAGPLSSATPVSAEVNNTVLKRGAVTNITRGRVSAINVQSHIIDQVAGIGPQVFHFSGMIRVEDVPPGVFCTDGDSGSLVVDSVSQSAVGIIVGRDESGTLVCPLAAVLEALGIADTAKAPFTLATTP